MSHYPICMATTATFILLSTPVFAQSVSNQGAADLKTEVFPSSRLAQSDEQNPSVNEDAPYWQGQASPDWHLNQKDLGIKISPGQYHGNRGPASEEQGIQLQFFSQ